MSSYISQHEQNILTGLFDRDFDTFSRPIVIWKAPIKQTIVTNQYTGISLFGFGTAPEADQYTYIDISGVYPAVVRYMLPRRIGESTVLEDTNSFVPLGNVKIKVRQDAYDFITSGTTDKFTFDNRDFYFVGTVEAHPFMGITYYYYQCAPKI